MAAAVGSTRMDARLASAIKTSTPSITSLGGSYSGAVFYQRKLTALTPTTPESFIEANALLHAYQERKLRSTEHLEMDSLSTIHSLAIATLLLLNGASIADESTATEALEKTLRTFKKLDKENRVLTAGNHGLGRISSAFGRHIQETRSEIPPCPDATKKLDTWFKESLPSRSEGIEKWKTAISEDTSTLTIEEAPTSETTYTKINTMQQKQREQLAQLLRFSIGREAAMNQIASLGAFNPSFEADFIHFFAIHTYFGQLASDHAGLLSESQTEFVYPQIELVHLLQHNASLLSEEQKGKLRVNAAAIIVFTEELLKLTERVSSTYSAAVKMHRYSTRAEGTHPMESATLIAKSETQEKISEHVESLLELAKSLREKSDEEVDRRFQAIQSAGTSWIDEPAAIK